MVLFQQPSKGPHRKMLEICKLPLTETFFSGYRVLMLDIKTFRSVQVQKEFFLTGHRSQIFVVKKIVDGKGLQQKLLFQDKNEPLPALWRKRMLRLMSLLELFVLTTFVFFEYKALPDFHWVKHKWQVLGRPQEKRGLREKVPGLPEVCGEDSNQSWFYEVRSTCVLPPK